MPQADIPYERLPHPVKDNLTEEQWRYAVAPYRCSLPRRQAASPPRERRVVLQRYGATRYKVIGWAARDSKRLTFCV